MEEREIGTDAIAVANQTIVARLADLLIAKGVMSRAEFVGVLQASAADCGAQSAVANRRAARLISENIIPMMSKEP